MMNLPTRYFYKVEETLITTDTEKKHFSDDQIFSTGNLSEDRTCALAYAKNRIDGLEKRQQFYELPFIPSGKYKIDSAIYSVTVSLIEDNPEHGSFSHPVYGEDEETMSESWELEKSLGIAI